jgi:hypothetical protein
VANQQSRWPAAQRPAKGTEERWRVNSQSECRPRPVSAVVNALDFNPRTGVRIPHGAHRLTRRWCNGKRGGLLSRRSEFKSRAAHAETLLRWRNWLTSPGPQPGVCGFESRTEHASPRPYRLMARPLAFQAGEDGSEPSGVTAEWRSSVVLSALIRRRSWVRIPPPQLNPVSFNGRTLPC